MHASCHTYERSMAHMWMSHASHMNKSCHTHKWVMSHACWASSTSPTDNGAVCCSVLQCVAVCYSVFVCVTWLVHMRAVTGIFFWRCSVADSTVSRMKSAMHSGQDEVCFCTLKSMLWWQGWSFHEFLIATKCMGADICVWQPRERETC